MRSRVIVVARRLGRLHLLLRDAGVRMLAEPPLDELRHFERVLAGASRTARRIRSSWV